MKNAAWQYTNTPTESFRPPQKPPRIQLCELKRPVLFARQASAKIAWKRRRNPPDLLMPTVLRSGPYRGFFYAGDRHEPPHVHVERDRSNAKYWLEPVTLESSSGFSRSELMDIYRLISEHRVVLLQKWHDYFGN